MSKHRTVRRSLALRRALVDHAERLGLELVHFKHVDSTTVQGAYRAMHELQERFQHTGGIEATAVDAQTGVSITARRIE